MFLLHVVGKQLIHWVEGNVLSLLLSLPCKLFGKKRYVTVHLQYQKVRLSLSAMQYKDSPQVNIKTSFFSLANHTLRGQSSADKRTCRVSWFNPRVCPMTYASNCLPTVSFYLLLLLFTNHDALPFDFSIQSFIRLFDDQLKYDILLRRIEMWSLVVHSLGLKKNYFANVCWKAKKM